MKKLFVLLLIFPLIANAAVYKCTVNGKLVFSDMQCSSNAEKITLKPTNSVSSENGAWDAKMADRREQVKAWNDSVPYRKALHRNAVYNAKINRINCNYNRKIAEINKRSEERKSRYVSRTSIYDKQPTC